MNWKKIVLGVVGAACLVSWIGLGAGLAMGVEKAPRIALAIAAALTTEGLMWSVALVLGVSVFQARRRIWAKITRTPSHD